MGMRNASLEILNHYDIYDDDFVDWVRGVLETGLIDREVGLQSRMKIITFFMQ